MVLPGVRLPKAGRPPIEYKNRRANLEERPLGMRNLVSGGEA